jgi:hypothetical protein
VQQKFQEKPSANNIEELRAYIKDTIISSAQDVIGGKQNEKN